MKAYAQALADAQGSCESYLSQHGCEFPTLCAYAGSAIESFSLDSCDPKPGSQNQYEASVTMSCESLCVKRPKPQKA
jgi:hypothetical protein